MSITYNTSIVRNGLVLHLDAANSKSYPGSGTAWTDLSGNGNNATLNNGVTYNGGVSIKDFSFDGIDDYGVIAHNAALKPTESITIEAWTNITQLDSAYRWIVRTGWAGSPYFFGVNINNRFLLVINDQSAQYQSTTAPLAQIGWHHYVGVYNKSMIKMYIDGIDTGYNYSYTAPISTNTLPVFIGGGSSSGTSVANSQFWKNTVGNVKIYNRAFSATEVQQNFEATRGRYNI
jgi:hypothetical protein